MVSILVHTSGLAELFELFAQVLLIVRGFEGVAEFLGKIVPVGEGIRNLHFLEVPMEGSSFESCTCIVDPGVGVIDSLGTKDIPDLQKPAVRILIGFSSERWNGNRNLWCRGGGGSGSCLRGHGIQGISEGGHKLVELILIHFRRVSLKEMEEDKCVWRMVFKSAATKL